MRIKKVSQTTATQAQVVNNENNSQLNAYSCAYVNNKVKDVYSTDEVKTNKVWIDNKPIYRKVISIGYLPNNDTKSVSIGYLSTEVTIVKLEGIAFYSNGITIPIPNVSDIGAEQVKLTINSNGEVVVTTYNDRTGATGYVILEYIKTTD